MEWVPIKSLIIHPIQEFPHKVLSTYCKNVDLVHAMVNTMAERNCGPSKSSSIFQATQAISCHLRLIYVFIFQQTASILNLLHPTVHCGHGIHYCCRSTFLIRYMYKSCSATDNTNCKFGLPVGDLTCRNSPAEDM